MAGSDERLAELGRPVSGALCVLPWLHRFTNLGGEIQLCCITEEHPESQLRTDDGAAIDVDRGLSEPEVTNCASLRRVRRQMLAGEWPAACEHCLTAERTSGRSRRLFENAQYHDELPRILAETQPDGSAPVRIRSRDYRFGNLCNLRCRMCHPRASLPLLPEVAEVRAHEFTAEQLEAMRHYDWFRRESFWDDFRRHCHDLDHLHFAGGEPLVIPEVARALDVCIEEGCAARVALTFNTNVTKLPPALLARWPRFRGVTLALSLDGIGAVNDYIRHPARWAAIERNLRTIDEEHARLNVTAAWVNTTVQVYNVLRLDELVEYLHRHYRFINPVPTFAPLDAPDYFDVRILPRRLKREAARRLRALADRLGPAAAEARAQIDGLITHMAARRPSPLRCAEFRRVTRGFDRLRGEDVCNVVPELAPLMAEGITSRAAEAVERGRNRLAGHPAVRRVRAALGPAVRNV
jgi:hypothetical protein